MMEFLRMGGEAAYVWSAYGITLAVVLFNAWWARWTSCSPMSNRPPSTRSGSATATRSTSP